MLVCWIHDETAVESVAARVLELRSVYRSLLREVRDSIILNPSRSLPRLQETGDLPGLLARFSDENRAKVQVLIGRWPEISAGSAEVKFLQGTTTVFRACKYSSEHLIVSIPPLGVTLTDVVERFGGQELQTTVRIPLADLARDKLDQFVEFCRGSYVVVSGLPNKRMHTDDSTVGCAAGFSAGDACRYH